MSDEEKLSRKQARMKLRKEEATERQLKEEAMAKIVIFLKQERAKADLRTEQRAREGTQARRDSEDGTTIANSLKKRKERQESWTKSQVQHRKAARSSASG